MNQNLIKKKVIGKDGRELDIGNMEKDGTELDRIIIVKDGIELDSFWQISTQL